MTIDSTARTRLERLLAFIDRDPNNLPLRKDAIREARDTGQWEIACQLITPTVAAVEPDVLMLRARCLHHLGRLEAAMEDCRKYLALAPDHCDATGLLSLLLYERGSSTEACSHAQAALRTNPEQPDALLASALAQFDIGEYASAQVSFETLARQNPGNGRAWLGLGLIELHGRRFDAAGRYLERAVQYMPEHVGTWHVLAWVHLLRSDVAAAQLAFDRAMALDRNFGESHGGIAIVAVLQGRESDALAGIKRALRLDPRTMAARYAQLLICQNHGKTEEAKALLEDFLSRPVSHGDLRYRDLVALQLEYASTLRASLAIH